MDGLGSCVMDDSHLGPAVTQRQTLLMLFLAFRYICGMTICWETLHHQLRKGHVDG